MKTYSFFINGKRIRIKASSSAEAQQIYQAMLNGRR
jgi:hypothetical protein